MGLPSCQKSSGRSFFGGTQQTFGNSGTSRPKIFVTLARASGVSGRNRHFDRRRSRMGQLCGFGGLCPGFQKTRNGFSTALYRRLKHRIIPVTQKPS